MLCAWQLNIRIGRFRPISRAVIEVNGTGRVVIPAPAVLQGLSDHFVFSSDRARHSVWRLTSSSSATCLQAVPYGTMSDNGIAGKDTLFVVARNPQSPVSFRFLQTENKHPTSIGSPSSSRRHAIFTIDGQRLVGSPKN